MILMGMKCEDRKKREGDGSVRGFDGYCNW
jgi:hypothetical protein